MQSLVKGFIAADIKKMVQTHNETGMEIAKVLCAQTNWPRKPVSMFNIYGSLCLSSFAVAPISIFRYIGL